MIDINKFDKDVLKEYQDSYLPEFSQARYLIEKMNVNNYQSRYSPQYSPDPSDLSWSRFISIMGHEIDHVGTPLTKIPQEIHHHASEAIEQAREAYRADRNLDWPGSSAQDVFECIKGVPDSIYNSRAGIVAKLAEVELDKGREIQKFLDEWKESLINSLIKVNLEFKNLPLHAKNDFFEIHVYENLMDKAVNDLEKEFGKLTKLFPRH